MLIINDEQSTEYAKYILSKHRDIKQIIFSMSIKSVEQMFHVGQRVTIKDEQSPIEDGEYIVTMVDRENEMIELVERRLYEI